MLMNAIILCGALFGGYVLLIVIIRIARRGSRVVTKPQEDYDWTIPELQRLRDAEQLSDEEFNRAREVILANARLRSSTNSEGLQTGFDVLPKRPQ